MLGKMNEAYSPTIAQCLAAVLLRKTVVLCCHVLKEVKRLVSERVDA